MVVEPTKSKSGHFKFSRALSVIPDVVGGRSSLLLLLHTGSSRLEKSIYSALDFLKRKVRSERRAHSVRYSMLHLMLHQQAFVFRYLYSTITVCIFSAFRFIILQQSDNIRIAFYSSCGWSRLQIQRYYIIEYFSNKHIIPLQSS